MARGAFPEAARAKRAFAIAFPKDARAPQAFVDAVIMNSRLEVMPAAMAESELLEFEHTFVPLNLNVWSEMAFALTDGFASRRDYAAERALLQHVLVFLDGATSIARKKRTYDMQTLRELELRARVRSARLHTNIGDHRGSDAEYQRAQKIVPELGVWPGKKAPRTTVKYSETMDLIAESLFHTAEQKRFEAERLPLPAYMGKGDRDSVMAFVNGPGEQWYKQREFLVKDATRLYASVLGMELPKPEPPKPPPPPAPPGMIGLLNSAGGDPNAPVAPVLDFRAPDFPSATIPSPQWAIAASERVGKLWTSFRQESLRMPIPAAWKPPNPNALIPGSDLTYAELKAEFICGMVEPAEEILKLEARAAYQTCLNLSVQHRIVNQHTDVCIHWLSKNYGAEYHEIDDFAPLGEFVSMNVFARPAPLPRFTH